MRRPAAWNTLHPVTRLLSMLLLLVLASVGCEGESDPSDLPDETAEGQAAASLEGEQVTPPFAVSGDCEGLLLVWLDEEGPHTAERRDEIPEAHREHVRVDSLRLPPEQRLDPGFVYLADLRAPGDDGTYRVRKVPRPAFEALIDRVSGAVAAAEGDEPAHGAADADVIIYGADWCGACRSTAGYLRERGVEFVEKNIERDAAAHAEMQAKCRRAGIAPSGIPVIDFRGTILTGFDPARLGALIDGRGAPI